MYAMFEQIVTVDDESKGYESAHVLENRLGFLASVMVTVVAKSVGYHNLNLSSPIGNSSIVP